MSEAILGLISVSLEGTLWPCSVLGSSSGAAVAMMLWSDMALLYGFSERRVLAYCFGAWCAPNVGVHALGGLRIKKP